MDKAQEKMEQIIISAMTNDGEYQVEDVGEHATEIAKALIFNGYRKPPEEWAEMVGWLIDRGWIPPEEAQNYILKPPDRPGLREKIRTALMDCMITIELIDGKDAPPYDYYTDRILALMIPRDKPPVVDNPYIYESEECRQHTAFAEGAQAQLDICIKHYGGGR